MEEAAEESRIRSLPLPSSSSSSSSAAEAGPSTEVQVQRDPDTSAGNHRFRRHRRRSLFRHHSPPRNGSYRFNVSLSDDMTDDVWSCLIVLVTFWFFASMTLILGFYGSMDLQLGPNYSRLITTNQLFVQSIKAEQIDGQQIRGPLLYGFHKTPSLDVETTWFETHNASIQPNFHKEWIFYLNAGSKVDISYDVKHPSSFPVSLVIAQGQDNLIEWIEDPSYPNTTLSWNIVHGSGRIVQEITQSATYYIALGNLNSNTVEVELNLTLNALLYDTANAYFKCSLYNQLCSFSLTLLNTNAVILTTPGPEQVAYDDGWYISLSYGPRWVTYFLGAGVLTTLAMLLFRFCNKFQPNHEDGSATRAGADNQEPLLSPKGDDLSSLGSSYDSASNDEQDLEEWIPEEGKQPEEGENSNNPRKLCVICFELPRDCFFLPCGHCAACFTCGSRVAEEAGTCPICRRRMKKVRKIFSV